MKEVCYEDDKDVIYALWTGPTVVNATITSVDTVDLHGFRIQYGQTGDMKKLDELSGTSTDLGACTMITLSGTPTSLGEIAFTLTMSNDFGSRTEEISVRILESIERIPYTEGQMARIVAEIETHFGDPQGYLWEGVDFLDLTTLQVQGGEVSATIAENQGGSATFTLLNDLDGQNLLSESLTWFKGTVQRLVPGIYVKIDLIEKGQFLGRITDGFISTISAEEDKVTIEIGDGNAFLGKQGTTLRRNYYNRESTQTFLLPIGKLTKDSQDYYFADLGTVGGTPLVNTLSWSHTLTEDTGTNDYSGIKFKDVSKIVLSLPDDVQQLFSIGFRMSSRELAFKAKGSAHFKILCGTEIFADADISFDLPDAHSSKVVEIPLDWSKKPVGKLTILISNVHESSSGTVGLRKHDSSQGGKITYTGYDFNWEPYYVLRYAVWESVSGATLDGTKILVTATSENAWMAPEGGDTQDGRAKLDITLSEASTLGIMEDIAGHFGTVSHDTLSCASEVGSFCIGGGYALDYLQKAADIVDPSGRRRTFLRTGFGDSSRMLIGDRYNVDDDPIASYSYGEVEGCVPFVSFSPHLTIKNRPKMVTLRSGSTVSGSTTASSIITTVSVLPGTAWASRYDATGHRFEKTESAMSVNSVNNVEDAVKQAYGEISSAEIDQWEGEMTLPGIVLDLIRTSGQYVGSGIPISVTDSRYAMTDYRCRIRQVAYDLNAMTTTITLNNYSMEYSGQISSTVALAVTGASQAFAAGDSTFYNTQYLYLETDDIGMHSQAKYLGANVRQKDSTNYFKRLEPSIGILPDGRYLIQAEFVSEAENADDYGLFEILHKGTKASAPLATGYTIPENLRPDAFKGQRIIICIVTRRVVIAE